MVWQKDDSPLFETDKQVLFAHFHSKTFRSHALFLSLWVCASQSNIFFPIRVYLVHSRALFSLHSFTTLQVQS